MCVFVCVCVCVCVCVYSHWCNDTTDKKDEFASRLCCVLSETFGARTGSYSLGIEMSKFKDTKTKKGNLRARREIMCHHVCYII